MMRSTTRRQPEEPGSSLDDSTYELLGESLLETSDDEAHTESIASTDGPTPDDTSDFSDDDNDYGAGDKSLQDSIHSSHAEISEEHPYLPPTTSAEDSALTEVPAYMDGSDSTWQIRLDEQSTEEPGVMHGSRVIKSLPNDASALPQVLSQYGSAQVRLVVKAVLSQRSIPTPDSYRILYIGMPEKWLEDIITSQIGAALTASPSISKSVMVRGQIEPYGPVIHVYRCKEIHTFAEREKPSHVLVILDDGQQLKFGPGIGSNSSGRPDLVVFCHPTIPSTPDDVQEFASASEVFVGENIPCIDLAQARPYGEGAPTYDSTSLRVCMEGRDDMNADYELKEVLPLDHYTFSQLDPSQLNRHLAFISPHLLSAPDMRHDTRTSRSWIANSFDVFVKKSRRQWHLVKKMLLVMVVFALVPALLQGSTYAPMLFQKSLVSELHSSISSKAPVLSSTITSSALTSHTVVPFSLAPSERSASRDLTIVPTQEIMPKQQPVKKGEKVGVFDIERTGDHQFVLRPSKEFANSRKKPQLQIQVSRESKAVPARYNRTVSGEYVVDLEQEYTVGTFNVSITTHSKPLLRQVFEITLGRHKSNLAQLFDKAKLNLISTPNHIWDVSTLVTHQIEAGLADLEATALHWADRAYGSSEGTAESIHLAKQLVQRQIAVGTMLLMRVPSASWVGLRQVTAPVRTSSPMMRARLNALRLRCKMEEISGLSSEDVNGKQSWACSKARMGAQEKDDY